MEQDNGHPVAQWLDKATEGIQFGPDRKAVRAELDGHLDDKIQDLQRIFPDLSAWEATQMALSGMGDPEEIGRELAKLHKPWLGYLWRASQITLGVVLAVGVCQIGGWLWTQVTAPNVGGTQDSWAVERSPSPAGRSRRGSTPFRRRGLCASWSRGTTWGPWRCPGGRRAPGSGRAPPITNTGGPRMTREMSTSAGLRGG